MKYRRIGSRGHIFSWVDPYNTNVYVINGIKHIFIVDTFLGPKPMETLKAKLANEGISGKPFIVFNTHADYDHIWGNQSFEGSMIISHESTLKRIHMQGKPSIKAFHKHMMGKVVITPPNLVFRKKLTFVEEGIELWHTPGHTGDSSSCYDAVDRVLLPGDNLETPYPHINLLNLKEYTQSLDEYTRLDAKIIIPGHDAPQHDKILLNDNQTYIRSLASGRIDTRTMDHRQLQSHYPNMVRLAELYIEKADAKKAKNYYDEALSILDLLESSPENEERRTKIKTRLMELA